MRIELVQATPNPLSLIADVASICYGKEEASQPYKLVKSLYKHGHDSVFEHVYFTFKIEGISRACLAQLTRHRHASYTVRSQRYCNEDGKDYMIPESIINAGSGEAYHDMMQYIYNFYEEMKQKGVKKEDARMILTNATTTDLYMSMNLRELIHIFNLRTSKQAQWEIRDLVNTIVDIVLELYPELDFMFRKEDEGGK